MLTMQALKTHVSVDASTTGIAPLVSIRDLGVTYSVLGQQLQALSGVSFDVQESTITAMVGPSGCGKSTLLRVLAGITAPTTGDVCVGGLAPEPYRKRHGVGVCF